jgi:hypothetical protein
MSGRQPPRLQDTAERSALPLPLPGDEPEDAERSTEQPPAATTEESAPATTEKPTPATAEKPPPATAEKPTPATTEKPTPAIAEEPPAEILVGAAFLGGIALALILKRLAAS